MQHTRLVNHAVNEEGGGDAKWLAEKSKKTRPLVYTHTHTCCTGGGCYWDDDVSDVPIKKCASPRCPRLHYRWELCGPTHLLVRRSHRTTAFTHFFVLLSVPEWWLHEFVDPMSRSRTLLCELSETRPVWSKIGSQHLLVFTLSNVLIGRGYEKAFNECLEVRNVFPLAA